MYGQTARKAVIRILKEAPELADLATRGEPPVPWGKIKDFRTRKLANRLISELWMMGFAVSARTPADKSPLASGRDPLAHKAWRNAKLPPAKPATKDIQDVQAPEPPGPLPRW